MNCQELIKELQKHSDRKTKDFNKSIIFTKAEILGVKIPKLKEIEAHSSLDFTDYKPGAYYEVDYLFLIHHLKRAKDLKEQINFLIQNGAILDNWSMTDSSIPYVKKLSFEEELPFIDELLDQKNEFLIRSGYLLLLNYIDFKNLSVIFDRIYPLFSSFYYGEMAQAWLLSKIAIDYPDSVYDFLKNGKLDFNLIQKTISKIRDSLLIPPKEKERFKALKAKLKKQKSTSF